MAQSDFLLVWEEDTTTYHLCRAGLAKYYSLYCQENAIN